MRYEIPPPPPGDPEDLLPFNPAIIAHAPSAPRVGSLAEMLQARPYGDEPDAPRPARPFRPYPPPVPVLDFVYLDEGGE